MAKLVIGCGYLGQRVARKWRDAGEDVFVLTRSPERGGKLAEEGFSPIVGDVTSDGLAFPERGFRTVLWAVGYDRAAGHAMREVYVEGLRRGLDRLPESAGRFIYISSTGVYGQAGGEWVDERSECHPSREGGKVCLEAERCLREHPLGDRSVILRLAGIYGPGRVPRLAEIRSGEPLAAPARGFLNLIHVEDAARIVLAAETAADVPALYVVADGHPVPRSEYYRYIAELLGAPAPRLVPPESDDPRARRAAADKRIRNDRLVNELPIRWKFPSYREGLADALRETGGEE